MDEASELRRLPLAYQVYMCVCFLPLTDVCGFCVGLFLPIILSFTGPIPTTRAGGSRPATPAPSSPPP